MEVQCTTMEPREIGNSALINCLLYLNLAGDGAAIFSIGSQALVLQTIMNSIIRANIKFAFKHECYNKSFVFSYRSHYRIYR